MQKTPEERLDIAPAERPGKLASCVRALFALACLAMLLLIGYGVTHEAHGHNDALNPGQRVSMPSRAAGTGAPSTLILITRESCHYCTESMPFYERLASAAKESGVRVLSVSTDPSDVNLRYLENHKVHVTSFVPLSDTDIRSTSTPTVILIRPDGVIIDSWTGLIKNAREREYLLGMLKRGGKQSLLEAHRILPFFLAFG